MKKLFKRCIALFLCAVLTAGLCGTGFAAAGDDQVTTAEDNETQAAGEGALSDQEETEDPEPEEPECAHVCDGDVTFDWSEDFTSCDAVYTCAECGEIITVPCMVESSGTEPDCTEEGRIIYTATAEINGETYSDTREEISAPPLGHLWKTPEFTWSGDGKNCTAESVCARCGVTETFVCEVTLTGRTEATCTEAGTETYKAEIELNGGICSSEKTVITGSALGHSYGEPSFSWAGDYASAAATAVCTRCGDAVTVSCEVVSSVTTEPGCVTDGLRTFTATAVFPWGTCRDSRTAVIPAPGSHTWDAGKVTMQATCTTDGILTYTCTVCGATRTETIPAPGHDYAGTVTAPACTEQGYTTYTCTRCGERYVADFTAALGHDYRTAFSWSEDHSSCTITITCSRCSFKETDPCSVTSVITKEPGCETLGETSYTASFRGLTETVTVADIPAPDHCYQAQSYVWRDQNGRTWTMGGEQDEDFLWNGNVGCTAHLICTVCGKTFTVDCTVTLEDAVTENGLSVVNFTATAGDSGLYFTVVYGNGRVLGVRTTSGSSAGEDVGDQSAAEANEQIGEVVSVSESGTLDMPAGAEAVTDTPATGTNPFVVIGICMIPLTAGLIIADIVRGKKKKAGRGQ